MRQAGSEGCAAQEEAALEEGAGCCAGGSAAAAAPGYANAAGHMQEEDGWQRRSARLQERGAINWAAALDPDVEPQTYHPEFSDFVTALVDEVYNTPSTKHEKLLKVPPLLATQLIHAHNCA